MSHDYLRALYRAEALVESLRSNAEQQASDGAYLSGYVNACTDIGMALADVATDVIEHMQLEEK